MIGRLPFEDCCAAASPAWCARMRQHAPRTCAPQEERVLPRVPLGACVAAWGADEEMGDYHSAYLGRRTTARRASRIASFPPFLMVQLKRCAAAARPGAAASRAAPTCSPRHHLEG